MESRCLHYRKLLGAVEGDFFGDLLITDSTDVMDEPLKGAQGGIPIWSIMEIDFMVFSERRE